MNVTVLGTETPFGSAVAEKLLSYMPEGTEVSGLGLPDFTVSDHYQIKEQLGKPDWVINCQQVTDPVEVENNHDYAYMVNMDGARYVAEYCAAKDIRLLHLSSAHVYDGMKPKPYTERDLPNPVNKFGASMVAGEKAVRGSGTQYLIIRPGQLVGLGLPDDAITSALPVIQSADPAIEVIEDERISPTHAVDLIEAMATLIRGDQHGLLQVASKGGCSWLELYGEIARLMGVEKEFRGVRSATIRSGVRIPVNTELEVHWYARWTGRTPSDWRDVVRRVIEDQGLLAENT